MAETQEIFSWNDGDKDRKGDPFFLLRSLNFQCAQLGRDLGKTYADSDPKQATSFDSWQVMQAITCQVFGLKPFDPETGAGMLANKVDEVLDSFIEFMDSKKKPSASTPI